MAGARVAGHVPGSVVQVRPIGFGDLAREHAGHEAPTLSSAFMDRVGARVLAVAPFAAAALGALVLAFAVMVFIGSRGFGYDFAAYDEAARRITAGASVYVPDTAARYAAGEYEGLYLYPPQLAIAMVALTVFDPTAATLAWLFIAYAIWIVISRGQNAGGEAAHLGGAAVGWLVMQRPHVLDRLMVPKRRVRGEFR